MGEPRVAGAVSQEALDRLVRARIAEIMSAAGVDVGRIGLEVLWDMPPSFVRSYEWLWRLIGEGEVAARGGGRRNDAEVGVAQDSPAGRMGGGAQGRTKDTEASRARGGVVVVRSGGSARRGSRGAARGGAALGVAGPGLEEFAALKVKIDKRLRGMAREIAELVKAEVGLDVETGGEVMRVDMGKLGIMRQALEAKAELVRRERDCDATIDE